MRAWSEEQNRVFDWFSKTPGSVVDPNNHLVLSAFAGTGKTTTIIEGVRRAPERAILVAAFSKIIQLELQGRIQGLTNVKAQTLHSVGLACVRRYRDNIKIGFNSDRADMITDAVCGVQVPDAIKKLVSKLHTKGREIKPHARRVGDLTEAAIRFECEPDEQWENSGFPLEVVEQFALDAMEFAANIKAGTTIDGSDMIFLPVRNGWLTPMNDMIVIDECQDMNAAQIEIAQGVLRPGGRICVVGDSNQAIFGFRGADSDSLDRLRTELRAGELTLSTTYRCGKNIVALAQELVPEFRAAEHNPDGIVRDSKMSELLEISGPGDFILSRVNAPLVSIAMKLLRSGKRTRIAGREIGKGLIALVRKLKGRSVPEFESKVTAWENKQIMRLETKLAQAVNGRKRAIEDKIADIRDQADMLLSLSEGAKNVDQVVTRIESLFADDEEDDKAKTMITCSSIHRAKGLEADRVFVLADTLRDWTQEERNLRYVAITRAKSELVFVNSQSGLD